MGIGDREIWDCRSPLHCLNLILLQSLVFVPATPFFHPPRIHARGGPVVERITSFVGSSIRVNVCSSSPSRCSMSMRGGQPTHLAQGLADCGQGWPVVCGFRDVIEAHDR